MTANEKDSFLNYTQKSEVAFNPFHFRQEAISYYPFIAVSSRRRRWLHLIFWIMSGCICITFISFVKPLGEAVARGGIILLCILLVLYGARTLVRKYYEKKRYSRWLWLSCLLVFVVAAMRTSFDLFLFNSITFKQDVVHYSHTDKVIKLYAFFLFVGFIFISLGSFYYISKNRLLLEHHYIKLKLQQAETQLSFLKAQVNPHFLFNTLNNIYAATELKSPQAPGMILQLSQLLRYITYTVRQKRINLTEEWEQIENYAKLFCSRDPQGKYPVTLTAEGDLRAVMIPPMLLLPMVENAFKHSDIHEQAADAYLKICLHYREGQLQFVVTNTYNDNGRMPDAEGGIGNDNIRQRLLLEYPERHLLHTEKDKGLFTANLTLTLHD